MYGSKENISILDKDKNIVRVVKELNTDDIKGLYNFTLFEKSETFDYSNNLPENALSFKLDEELQENGIYRWVEIRDLATPFSVPIKDQAAYPGVDFEDFEFKGVDYRSVVLLMDMTGSYFDDEERTLTKQLPELKSLEEIEERLPPLNQRLYYKAFGALNELVPDNPNADNTFDLLTFQFDNQTSPSPEINHIIVSEDGQAFNEKVSDIIKGGFTNYKFRHFTPLKTAIEEAGKILKSNNRSCNVLIIVTDGDGSNSTKQETWGDVDWSQLPNYGGVEIVGYNVYEAKTKDKTAAQNTQALKEKIRKLPDEAPRGWVINIHFADTENDLKKVMQAIKLKYRLARVE